MIAHWPKEIQEAVEKIWEYSYDSLISMRTYEEADEEGYEIPPGKTAWMFVAYLPAKPPADNEG